MVVQGALNHLLQMARRKNTVLRATGSHPVHLAPPMPTAVDNRFTHLDLSATPLFARNGNARECGEEGNG